MLFNYAFDFSLLIISLFLLCLRIRISSLIKLSFSSHLPLFFNFLQGFENLAGELGYTENNLA
jgi:hypothetical protein